VGPPKEWQF